MWFLSENLLVIEYRKFYIGILLNYIKLCRNLSQFAINCDNVLSYFTHHIFKFRRTDIAFCPAVQADFTQITFFGKVS